jgi:hypothetical protein
MIDPNTQTREDRLAREELIRQGILIPHNAKSAAIIPLKVFQDRFAEPALPDFIRKKGKANGRP